MSGRVGPWASLVLGVLLVGCTRTVPVPAPSGGLATPAIPPSSSASTVGRTVASSSPAASPSGVVSSPALASPQVAPSSVLPAASGSPAAATPLAPSSVSTSTSTSSTSTQTVQASGFVKSIMADPARVEIAHQAISGLELPVETTDFLVRDAQALTAIKAGDAVEFTVTITVEGEQVITEIKKASL